MRARAAPVRMRAMQLTRAGVWGAAGLFAAIVAFGLGSVWLATRQPSIALGVETPAAIVLLLATGLALAAAGCAALVGLPGEAFGRLAIADRARVVRRRLGEPRSRHLAAVHGGPRARLGVRTPRRARDPRVRDEPLRPARRSSRSATSRASCLLGLVPASRAPRPRTAPPAPRTSSPSSTRPPSGDWPRRPGWRWPRRGPRSSPSWPRRGSHGRRPRRGD